MVRTVFVLALLTLFGFALSAVADDSATIETEVKSYKKCPCQCFFGKEEEKAYRQCRKSKYYHCEVSDCYEYGQKGKWCCYGYGTVRTVTTPPPTPTEPCECECVDHHLADEQCMYKDHCEVKECHGDHYDDTKYKCCDKH